MPTERLSYIRSAESVTAGHPDKLCDAIAGALLDEAIHRSNEIGKLPRFAMEVGVKGDREKGGLVTFLGEVTLPTGVSLSEADYQQITAEVLRKVGYTDPASGFSAETNQYVFRITQQSTDIARGVSRKRTGAGDQGKMIGGAIAETPELMPLPIALAHGLTHRLTEVRNNGQLEYLRPDGKSQVVVRYDEHGLPRGIRSITISTAHAPNVDQNDLQYDVRHCVVDPVLDAYKIGFDPDAELYINWAGPWTIYGPTADAGHINRKIVVDTYGGFYPVGGGGLNGKDPTKVDLSGHLATRCIAKQLVREKLASQVELEVAYTIGHPEPVGLRIDTHGTSFVREQLLYDRAHEILDLSVDGIIDAFELFQPLYASTAVGGFFGRAEFPWEQTK